MPSGTSFPLSTRALEVAVLRERPALHGAERAHAPVLLEALAVLHDDLAGRLLDAGQGVAEHHGVGAGGQRLGHVAGELHAAVGDDRHAVAPGDLGAVEDGRDLGHADAGDDPGGADRTRPDADLHGVGAGVDRAPRWPRRWRRCRRRPRCRSWPSPWPPSRGPSGRGRGRCRRRSRRRRGRRARRPGRTRRATAPTAAATRSRPRLVLRGVRVVDPLLDVLDGDEAGEHRRRRRRSGASRCGAWPRITLASSSVVPCGAVTRPSRVIASDTGRSTLGSTKRRSRLVMMPTSRPASSVTGTPEMWKWAMTSMASAIVAVGRTVTGLADHPRLGPLDPVDLGGLVLDREVAVDARRCRRGGPWRWRAGPR